MEGGYLRDLFITELEKLQKRTVSTVGPLTPAQLAWRPPGANGNPIGFLLWHLARREDYHLQNRVRPRTQLWQAEGWHQRLGHDPEATGFGFSAEQVASFRVPSPEETIAYYQRVRQETLTYLRESSDATLLGPMPDVPDTSIAAYLLARIGHEHEHWGQIDYLKGILPASG